LPHVSNPSWRVCDKASGNAKVDCNLARCVYRPARELCYLNRGHGAVHKMLGLQIGL